MASPTPCVSFIGIVDFSEKAKWLFMTESVTELLGYEPHELIGRPSLELVHPDEFPRVKQLHYDTIQQDKAAVLVYLRMKHKDPFRGYVLCGVSRTVVHNVLVGSVSFASPGKALHNASTAQEITVITESAANFEFRRWHDPSPMPPSPIPDDMRLPNSPSSPRSPLQRRRAHSRSPDPIDDSDPGSPPAVATALTHHSPRAPMGPPVISFPPLSSKSFRTAFILDRFSTASPILYASNDLLLGASAALGRPFYDFVRARDEGVVRAWISCVKGWGVNERGAPSDGGFGFGRFGLLVNGRDSCGERMPEPAVGGKARHRRASQSAGGAGRGTRPARYVVAREGGTREREGGTEKRAVVAGGRPAHREREREPEEEGERFLVDAIFSAHSDGLMVILRRAS
ncbi:hypothetical protein HYPSUDRAFT_185260 [Hypholoma sublateritium FD-334 SS-4]|uniref:PAS domain-containing protein n=1 Tax=Hypholoma sublateritium (strain FD-334 SS-4) TaxID=945553 RepID=A0A0D2MHX6_HYPSF|nr:hypothetical protein HYPSUDRAFT_185260 [Hypholoma sublateritium FD-334 SS-4]